MSQVERGTCGFDFVQKGALKMCFKFEATATKDTALISSFKASIASPHLAFRAPKDFQYCDHMLQQRMHATAHVQTRCYAKTLECCSELCKGQLENDNSLCADLDTGLGTKGEGGVLKVQAQLGQQAQMDRPS